MFLCTACWLRAQGTPELGLDVNGQAEAVVAKGWPLLIRVVVIPADDQPLKIGLASGAWTQALQLTITDQNGAVQKWPTQLVAAATASLSLSGISTGEAVWLVAPAGTSAIPDGLYSLSVTLNTTSGAAAGAWSGSVQSSGATVQLGAEPVSLSPEDEASKYLAMAAYARLRGDAAGVRSALDTLISRQPDMLEAYTEKADLLAAGGDYAGALALSQQALDKFNAKNPNAPEAPVILQLRVMAMADQLAAQQRAQAGNAVASVLAGNKVEVLTPESIASAYGTKLATGTVLANGPPQTVLGGTTVSIKDSGGATSPAQIYFVSSGQVNYFVPATVALGAAVVTFSAGDGTVQTGAVTIANVQPGLFTMNTALLIAANVVRLTPDGRQVYENDYNIDGTGNLVAAPVDVTNGQVYLVLYGTGIRRATLDQVTMTIGGVNAPVLYSGAQASWAGLDQINVQVPASLAGKGDVPIVLTVAGKQANSARITIK